MTLHRNLLEAVHIALQQIFEHGKYADKVIEKTLKSNPKWGSRDRKLIAETTYGVVRWYRLLQHVTQSSSDYWLHVAAWLVWNSYELPHWKEFLPLKNIPFTDLWKQAISVRALRESIPDWLDDMAVAELGSEKWEQELTALNQTAEVVLRANTLKITPEKLKKALESEGYECQPLDNYTHALQLAKRQNVFSTKAFKSGWFEVQDAGSQAIAPFLTPQPGTRVIDACAGAGGKTLHLAALMQNKGKIIALDIEDWKLQELKNRASRNGVSIIEPKVIEGSKTIKRLAQSADYLLLDVPCSGLGVLRRNPDAKWKLNEATIEKVKKIQTEILDSYPEMLKPGGTMVYATCSILPSENQNQVAHFLSRHPQYTLLEERTIWPSQGFDGFYMAKIFKRA